MNADVLTRAFVGVPLLIIAGVALIVGNQTVFAAALLLLSIWTIGLSVRDIRKRRGGSGAGSAKH